MVSDHTLKKIGGDSFLFFRIPSQTGNRYDNHISRCSRNGNFPMGGKVSQLKQAHSITLFSIVNDAIQLGNKVGPFIRFMFRYSRYGGGCRASRTNASPLILVFFELELNDRVKFRRPILFTSPASSASSCLLLFPNPIDKIPSAFSCPL